MTKSSIENFIKKAKAIHGEDYDYSKSQYTNAKDKIEIICKQHGSFFQIVNNHLRGHGCKKCGEEKCKTNRNINLRKCKSIGMPKPEQGIRFVGVGNGKFAKVDEEDYEKVSAHGWSTSYNYANCCKVGKMHRFILGIVNPKIYVDHINGDVLDNRKSNLRIATNQENCFNTKSHKDSFSKYKGVTWFKRDSKWRTSICKDGKTRHIGYFQNEVDAAKAYDKKAKELFGEFAYLNFPD